MKWHVERELRMMALFGVIVAGVGSIVATGGGSNTPAPPPITIVTDCAKDDITLGLQVVEVQQSSTWRVKVTLDVKCRGTPIRSQVRIEVGNWWTVVLETDANGHLERDSVPKPADASGTPVTVTVQGTDGERPETVTVP